MVLDASFSGKVMVNKKWIRISYRIDGQPLAHQIVLPLRRVAKVYYDAATSLLALVVVKQPTFWIQHQVQVARAPAATDGAPVATAKFAWRETPVDDPSPGKTLSKFQLLRIGSVTKGGFDKLFDHISHLAKRTRPEIAEGKPATSSYRTEIPVAAPEADFAADSDAEDGAEETINGDFGPQKGIANMAAFDAEIMRDFLVDVDKSFYDFASHRAEDVPDTSIRTVADAPCATSA
ncbi:hypothetical protein JL722_4590 [Aureococcus anophagefferens]|nr:hypothetical protein JL722_4590 [Aureococcus anophagefferens]